MLVGSGSDCDLRIVEPSVSRRHARLVVGDDRVEVVDLGSRNGTFVASRRITTELLDDGDEVVFGSVTMRLDQVSDADLEPGLQLLDDRTEDDQGRTTSTLGLRPVDVFTRRWLPGLLEQLRDGDPPHQFVQSVGAALFDALPVLTVEITTSGNDAQGVVYASSRSVDGATPCPPVSRHCGPLDLEVHFVHPSMERTFQALIDSAGCLIEIAAGNAGEPSRPSVGNPPSLPVPETVEAELRRVYRDAIAVAGGDIGVLIGGESGTGKELLARFIHAASQRAKRQFIALNCAALPRDLLEAELFGIEGRVATGVDARPGTFEAADGGTLFLDEIGDMDLETQASILRVLQEGEVFRIGGKSPRGADVRIIAATNRDMSRLLANGTFREDLYYRIATWEVTVPPLRHRRGDIPNLAAHFLERAAKRRGVAIAGVSRAALAVLESYRWPGNVRQLEKEMERAALFVPAGGLLKVTDLSAKIVAEKDIPGDTPLTERLDAFERSQISATLQQTSGDVPAAAAALGLGRSTLYRRIKKLHLDPTRFAGADWKPEP